MNNPKNIQKIVEDFVTAINRQDVELISRMMSVNHRFIDGMGEVIQGSERMKQSWIAYLKMMPDYHIEIRDVFVSGRRVIFLGEASGTYTANGNLKPENFWKVPAAWRAVVLGDKIQEWQVFADNEPVRQIMKKEGTLDEK
jgi:ketosteroid isomerase-like protein